VKRFVTENYERARKILGQYQPSLEKIAAELLTREVLDGDQVRRIVKGLPLEDLKPAGTAGPAPSHEEESGRRSKERPGIVPPLADPLPQE
jgi:cell division protease FtsH